MWIESSTATEARPVLLCDECGALFTPDTYCPHDRRSVWSRANIAGWARVARAPERHLCSAC